MAPIGHVKTSEIVWLKVASLRPRKPPFFLGKKRELNNRPQERPEGSCPTVTAPSQRRSKPPSGRPALWGPGRAQRRNLVLASANPDSLRACGRLGEFDQLLHSAKVDIAGIQEARWFDDATIDQPHYHFLLTKATASGQQGVGIAIRQPLLPSLMAVEYLGPRLMWARFRGKARNLSLIVAYAPTNAYDTSEEERDDFYAALHHT